MTDINKPSNRPLQVGQALWFQSSERFITSGDVIVTKIGRKWAYLCNGQKIDLTDWISFSCCGQCWLTKSHFDAHAAKCVAWSKLRLRIERTHSPPSGATLEAIRMMTALIDQSYEGITAQQAMAYFGLDGKGENDGNG